MSIEVPKGMDIIFEDSRDFPLACTFLVRLRGWQPKLWELLKPLEKERTEDGQWRVWTEDFYKVVKQI